MNAIADVANYLGENPGTVKNRYYTLKDWKKEAKAKAKA